MNTSDIQAVGHFQLQTKLRRGMVADVWQAYNSLRQCQVLLKLIQPGKEDAQDGLEAEQRGAILQEHLAKQDLPVPQIFWHGHLDGYYCIEMEWIEGDDLSSRIKNGPISPDGAARIAIKICAMLEAAHAVIFYIEGKTFSGVVHGDLKPDNIRLTPRNEVKILDFGIAKALSMTRKLTGQKFGSRAYCSPERLETAQVNLQSDLWSLGVVLYEMIAGCRPFSAENTSKLDKLIESHTRSPTMSLIPDDCPVGLRSIILKLLHPQIEQRYPDASRVKSDLQLFLQNKAPAAQNEAPWQTPTENDRTIRTHPPGAEVEGRIDLGEIKTRPTLKPEVTVNRPEGIAPAPKPSPVKPIIERRPINLVKTIKRAIFLFALLALIYIVGKQLMAINEARKLNNDLASERLTDMESAYGRYKEIESHAVVPLRFFGMHETLKQKIIAEADLVFKRYREATATVWENEWRRVKDHLGWVMEMDPNDPMVKMVIGMRRYCEGHISRINGDAQRKRGNWKEANEFYTDAIIKFDEAADLISGWPDPHVGEFRVLADGLGDLERASKVCAIAVEKGYQPRQRDTALMASGYQRDCKKEFDEAKKLEETQRDEYLKQAKQNCEKALDEFNKIKTFPGTPEKVKVTQKLLDSINKLLDPPTTSEPDSEENQDAKPTTDNTELRPETTPNPKWSFGARLKDFLGIGPQTKAKPTPKPAEVN
jgi:serine/threonine protein kinase